MDKEVVIDKAHAYLNNRFFPWNFVVEPVSEDAIKHYLKYAIPIGSVKRDLILMTYDPSKINDAITDEVRIAVNDYLVDPYNRHAKKVHGRFSDDYPFAYTKDLVYSILHELGWELGDTVDIGSILDILGVSFETFKRMESTIKRSIRLYREKVNPGITASILLNRDVIHIDGTELGTLRDITFERRFGTFVDLRVKPTRRTRTRRSRFRKIGRIIDIPMHDVRLTNVFNNHITLNY